MILMRMNKSVYMGLAYVARTGFAQVCTSVSILTLLFNLSPRTHGKHVDQLIRTICNSAIACTNDSRGMRTSTMVVRNLR